MVLVQSGTCGGPALRLGSVTPQKDGVVGDREGGKNPWVKISHL